MKKDYTKREFIAELVKRVRLNSLYHLSFFDFDEKDKRESFDEWLHFLSDNGIESLFQDVGSYGSIVEGD